MPVTILKSFFFLVTSKHVSYIIAFIPCNSPMMAFDKFPFGENGAQRN